MDREGGFIEQNLGLVHLCANRFRSRGIEYDDLYSAGCIGLIKATAAFDTERGVKFSTYAVPVILGEIRRLFRDGGILKVSRSIKELSLRASRERERFCTQEGREPLLSELAERLDVSIEAVSEALAVGQPPLSLTPSEDENGPQIDLPVAAPDERISDILALKSLISELEPNDRRLLYLRYFENKTQSETARYLSMTQVQVSRREKKLLNVLREQLIV